MDPFVLHEAGIIDRERLLRLAEECVFEECTYSDNGITKVNSEIRSGQVSYTNWTSTGIDLDRVFGNGEHLVNEQILLYQKGDHFISHVDTQINNRHIGTLCCIVCSDDIEGGQLVLETDPPQECSGIVFIPLGLKHYVTPIKNGKRYVFKGSVIMNTEYAYVQSMTVVADGFRYKNDIPASDEEHEIHDLFSMEN